MLESYNMSEFGKHLLQLRLSFGYTQEDVSLATKMHINSIRRIEQGKVIPKFENLVHLSNIYKSDLLLELKRYSAPSSILELYEQLDQIIIEYDIDRLEDLIIKVNTLKKNKNINTLISESILNQFSLLLHGINLYYQKDAACIDLLTRSMQTTNPNFEINAFMNFKYSSFEYRILLLISLSLLLKDDYVMSNFILKFILSHLEIISRPSWDEKLLITKVLFNLSYNSHLLDLNAEAISYSSKGVEYCQKHHILYTLAPLLFRRGIAKYSLGYSDYKTDLSASLSILKISENSSLNALYTDVLTKKYNIIL